MEKWRDYDVFYRLEWHFGRKCLGSISKLLESTVQVVGFSDFYYYLLFYYGFLLFNLFLAKYIWIFYISRIFLSHFGR